MLGWIPDRPKRNNEKQDWNADDLLSLDVLESSASNRSFIVSVLDQGNMNTCVANAVFQQIRADHKRQGITNPKLGSRLWGYYLSRAQHSAVHLDEGTYLRTLFTAIDKLGYPPEDSWPYLHDKVNGEYRWSIMPATDAFMSAHDQRTPVRYYRIYQSGYKRITAIKRAISEGRTVSFGALITNKFIRGDFDIAVPPEDKDAIAGGHAMLVVGYDSRSFDIVNSWGTDWKDGGYCKFSYDYIVSSYCRDFWVVENSPVLK